MTHDNKILPGDMWADKDPRHRGRMLRVTSVDGDFVVFGVATPSGRKARIGYYGVLERFTLVARPGA